ncbi:MAG: peptide ABC transporter substrate-binding protein [Verrucomicrobiota bacterium]|nr:peptide ABC transporter substrate-binding protein [Verrucomicrobiota bacterium]
MTVCRMLFEGLSRISREGNTELALASSVEISDDRLEYTFHLRDALWSNGDPVTSEDFIRSWKTTLDPKFPTDIAYQLYLIKNAQKVKAGELSSEVLGVVAPDSKTLIVQLEQPTPYFLDVCSMPSYFPVPSTAEILPEWAMHETTFVGNGPFILKRWNHTDELDLEKNSQYLEASQISLEQIEFVMVSNDTELRMFEDGKLDWAGSPLSTIPVAAVKHLKETNELKVSPFSATYFYRINTQENAGGKKNPLSNASLRRALAITIDREAIVTHLLQGGQAPARSLVPPDLGLFGNGYFTDRDQEGQAKALLGQALQELGISHLDPLVITFASSDRNLSISQAIQKQWEQALGIEVKLQAVESKAFFQGVKDRLFSIAAGSWIADFNDPVNFLEVFKFKESSTNNTGWQDANYIDLLERSAVCKNSSERKRLLREAEEILMDQMPIIPIFHFALNYLQREGIEGIALSPLGQIDFRWVHKQVADPSRSMR